MQQARRRIPRSTDSISSLFVNSIHVLAMLAFYGARASVLLYLAIPYVLAFGLRPSANYGAL